MVFLVLGEQEGGRNVFLVHILLRMLQTSVMRHVWSCEFCQKPLESQSPSWAPLGAGSALHLCTRGPSLHHLGLCMACGWPDRRARRKKKKKKDLAGGQSSRSSYRCCYLHYFHSEEQRGGCQQLSGTQRASVCSLAQPIRGLEQTGYHFTDTEHLCSDEGSASSLCGRSWRRKDGRTPTCHRSQTSAGDQRESSASGSASDAPRRRQTGKASALIPH